MLMAGFRECPYSTIRGSRLAACLALCLAGCGPSHGVDDLFGSYRDAADAGALVVEDGGQAGADRGSGGSDSSVADSSAREAGGHPGAGGTLPAIQEDAARAETDSVDATAETGAAGAGSYDAGDAD